MKILFCFDFGFNPKILDYVYSFVKLIASACSKIYIVPVVPIDKIIENKNKFTFFAHQTSHTKLLHRIRHNVEHFCIGFINMIELCYSKTFVKGVHNVIFLYRNLFVWFWVSGFSQRFSEKMSPKLTKLRT